jgi:hypothetical protein
MSNNNKPEFEIISLHWNREGRSCFMHSHCVIHAQDEDILLLLHHDVTIGESTEPEHSIVLRTVVNSTIISTAGLVLQSVACLEWIKENISGFCVVFEVHVTIYNPKKWSMKPSYGIAFFLFLVKFQAISKKQSTRSTAAATSNGTTTTSSILLGSSFCCIVCPICVSC